MRATVCIPTIRAAALGRTVRSVLGQTWQDWELLVVGQGDAANEAVLRAAVSEVAGHDPRVTYVHLRELGCSRARNAGTRLCRGRSSPSSTTTARPTPRGWRRSSPPSTPTRAGRRRRSRGRAGEAWSPHRLPTVMPAEAVYDPALTPQSPPAGWDWIGANCAFRLTAPPASASGRGDRTRHAIPRR